MNEKIDTLPKENHSDPDRALELAIRSLGNTTPKTDEIIERAKAFDNFLTTRSD